MINCFYQTTLSQENFDLIAKSCPSVFDFVSSSKATLELLYNLQQNLQVTQNQDEEDRELLMRLAPLYQQDREQAKQQGIQHGERLVVENLLKVRFGEINNELKAIIEPLLALSPEEFTPLLLELSREELINRFC